MTGAKPEELGLLSKFVIAFAILLIAEDVYWQSAAEDIPEAPYFLGLALIFCGILTLVVSIWQHHWTLRYLWGGSFAAVAGMTKEGSQTPLYAVAVAVILVGVSAFLAVLLRSV